MSLLIYAVANLHNYLSVRSVGWVCCRRGVRVNSPEKGKTMWSEFVKKQVSADLSSHERVHPIVFRPKMGLVWF